LQTIPCIIRHKVDDVSFALAQWDENAVRLAYTPLEAARGVARLAEVMPGASHVEVAKAANISAVRLGGLLKIHALPDAAKEAISTKRLEEAHAVLFAGLFDVYSAKLPTELEATTPLVAVIAKCSDRGWSLKALKQFVDDERMRLGAEKKAPSGPAADDAAESKPDSGGAAVEAGQGTQPARGAVQPELVTLFVAEDHRLVVNTRYLQEGRATPEEKAALDRKIRELLDLLRKTPVG
jgi:ParB-like chromosome segregation protein Spo0J